MLARALRSVNRLYTMGREAIEVFDALYEVVLRQAPLEQAFVDRPNAANELLQPRISEAIKRVAQAQLERRRFIEERRASKTQL